MIAMQLTSEGEPSDKSIVSPSLVSCAETKSKWAIKGAGLSASIRKTHKRHPTVTDTSFANRLEKAVRQQFWARGIGRPYDGPMRQPFFTPPGGRLQAAVRRLF